MRVAVCGARGSTPSPGPEFCRYGGHTSCVAIAHDGDPPTLVLDAGTGLRRLTALLDGEAFRGTLLLGHLHWDHTEGLPFFRAGDRPDARVRVLLPEQAGDAADVLARSMSPPHFPIHPHELRGEWTFDWVSEGCHEVEGFQVLAREIPHKGGRTFGYRVSDGRSTLAYLSDHSPIAMGPGPDGFGEYHPAALELARGADLLLHDAQYTPEEFEARSDFGHSAIDYAVGLAREAGVRHLLLFHHDPDRTDDELDILVRRYGCGAAGEGTVVTLPESDD